MTNDPSKFEELGAQWKSQRPPQPNNNEAISQLIAGVQSQQLQSVKTHLLTIAILSITLIIIYCFYLYVARFQEALSISGGILMLTSLAIRIGTEIISLSLLLRIDFSLAASASNLLSIRFHSLRRLINGPIMYITLAAYIVGFFMLSPEFSLHLSNMVVALMDVGFVIGAVILLKYLHKIVNKEKLILAKMRALQDSLDADN